MLSEIAELATTANSSISYLAKLRNNWSVLLYDLPMGLYARECALGVTFCPSLSLGPNLRVLPCTSNSLGGRMYLLGSALYCIIGVLFRYYFRLFPKSQSWSSADSTFGYPSSTFDFFNGRETWSLVNWGTFPWSLMNGEHWLCFGTGPDQTHYRLMEGWLTLLGITF